MKILINCILIFTFLISCSESETSDSEYITIGTFNIAWLGDGENDTKPRSDKDYQLVYQLIKQTKADIIGLQEIENESAILKVLGQSKDYKFFVCNSGGSQNLAVIYKSGIDLKFVSNYEPIAVEKNKTRPGAIFSLKSGNFDPYLMIVHFKSTSRYDSTEYLEEKSRQLRAEQAKVLNNWIDSMLNFSSEKDIFVLGDFNDYPSRKNNPTLTSLLDNKNIEFLTFDMKSCKFEYLGSIDHIVITNNIKNRYLANSLRMYDINSAFTDAEVENISDHCPVLATFNIQLKDDD